MKKLIVVALMALCSLSAFAQKDWHMSINLSSSSPGSQQFNDLYKLGYGSSIRIERRLNDRWDLTGEIGGNIHSGKTIRYLFTSGSNVAFGDLTYPNMNIYNYRVGGRFRAFGQFYLTTDLGVSSYSTDNFAIIRDPLTAETFSVPIALSTTDFSMSHGIGYLFEIGEDNGIDVGLRFDWSPGNNLSSGQFRVGYRFGL